MPNIKFNLKHCNKAIFRYFMFQRFHYHVHSRYYWMQCGTRVCILYFALFLFLSSLLSPLFHIFLLVIFIFKMHESINVEKWKIKYVQLEYQCILCVIIICVEGVLQWNIDKPKWCCCCFFLFLFSLYSFLSI